MPRMPSPWWSSWKYTNVFLSRTKKHGVPWLSRSLVSGSARAIRRTAASAPRPGLPPVPLMPWFAPLVLLGCCVPNARLRRDFGATGARKS